ncbi:MAG TPA: hypothetical protein VEI97_11545, partial [bacterium]|nr:hypothetical protein [bacterium]
ADDLARLSARAHGLRVTGQFSVPLLVVRAGQPVWRAVVSGRALQTPGPLDRDRRALRTAPVPPAAPLDPLYPLAALAVTSADGMGRALEEVGQRGYDRHRRLQTAFGLGQLYWWSLEPQQEEFFAMLAQDQGAGSPLDRLAALAGAVQGVNNLLMADDPDAAPLIPPFVQRWAQAIREPWVDAAAKEFWGEPYSHASFTLLAQCPEAPGYLEAMPGWAAAGEPGEEFLLLCYFSQISYATYLAAEYPEGLRRILARAPYPNDRLNAMLFQAYLEEMIRPRELAEELWPQAVPLGLRSLASESNYIPLAFALSLGRPWQEVWPAIQDRLAAVAQVGDPDRTLTLWPFAPNKPHQPICPLKRVRPGVAQPPVEDPLFFAAVDAELRRLWPTATPAFKLAVLKVHLPRAERAAQPLQPWLKYRAEIAPQLGRIEDQETLARLRAVFGR